MQDADREAFLELQARFLQGLAARLAQVRDADPAVRDRALHQLAGAAGAYELDELGMAARRAQDAVRAGDEAGIREAIRSLAALASTLAPGDTIP